MAARNGAMTPNLGFAAAVAEFGMLLRDSEFKGDATWSKAQELARRYRGEDPDGYRAEFVRLIDLAAALDAQQMTSPQSAALGTSALYNHAAGRTGYTLW